MKISFLPPLECPWWLPRFAIWIAASVHLGLLLQSIQPSTVDLARPLKVTESFFFRYWTIHVELQATDGFLAALSICTHVKGPCQLWYTASCFLWICLWPWECILCWCWCSLTIWSGLVNSAIDELDCLGDRSSSSDMSNVRCWNMWVLFADRWKIWLTNLKIMFGPSRHFLPLHHFNVTYLLMVLSLSFFVSLSHTHLLSLISHCLKFCWLLPSIIQLCLNDL